MYVSENADDNIVQSAFDSYGCQEVISLSAQYIPLAAVEGTPEIPLVIAGIENSDYLVRRNSYFFDKSAGYKIYYIPDEYKDQALEAASYIDSTPGISAGVDLKSSYQWIVPAVCIFFAVFLLVYSDRKLLFAAAAIFPLLFSFSFPFYASAAGVCLFLFSIFLALRVWGRRGSFSFLSKNVYIAVCSVSPVIICFLTGIRPGIIFIITICAVAAALYLYNTVSAVYNRRYSFCPVKIRPAGMIPLVTEKTKKSPAVMMAAVAVILIFSLFSFSGGTAASAGKNIMLPSAKGISGSIPDIEDYINWQWESVTYPYVSLNAAKQKKTPADGDEVRFPRYVTSSAGITETENVIVFGPEFRQKAMELIDSLPYPAIEKMMKKQGISFNAGYSSAGSQSVTILTIIQLSSALFISFFCCLSALRRRR